MKWKQSQDKDADELNAEELNEYNAPTKPLLPPMEEPVPNGELTPTEEMLPMPLPYGQSFPFQQGQGPSAAPSVPVYPVLPPAPTIQQGHRPAGSAASLQPEKSTGSAGSRQSPVPLFVGLFFVAVQFLLLVSFLARLINLPSYQQWLGVIYGISSLFLLPFRLLFEHVTLPFSLTIGVEIYTLLAILVYGLLSRLLVRLLKALLRSR